MTSAIVTVFRDAADEVERGARGLRSFGKELDQIPQRFRAIADAAQVGGAVPPPPAGGLVGPSGRPLVAGGPTAPGATIGTSGGGSGRGLGGAAIPARETLEALCERVVMGVPSNPLDLNSPLVQVPGWRCPWGIGGSTFYADGALDVPTISSRGAGGGSGGGIARQRFAGRGRGTSTTGLNDADQIIEPSTAQAVRRLGDTLGPKLDRIAASLTSRVPVETLVRSGA